jgi:hypothetical protein
MTDVEPDLITQRDITKIYSLGLPGTENAVKALIKRGEFALIDKGCGPNES